MKHTPRTPRSAPARRELLHQAQTATATAADGKVRIPTEVIFDRQLSPEACGVYTFLCSLPPGSPVPSAEDLAGYGAHNDVGIVEGGLRELEQHGYIERAS